mgnify:CR=1 FL=1
MTHDHFPKAVRNPVQQPGGFVRPIDQPPLPPCEPGVQPNSVAETTIVLQTTTGQSCRSCNSYTSKS